MLVHRSHPMSGIRSKVARLRGHGENPTTGSGRQETPSEPASSFRSRIDTLRLPGKSSAARAVTSDSALALRLHGEVVSDGLIRFQETRDLPVAIPRPSELVPTLMTAGAGGANPLFLDTETTGLAGGTGTIAFLVGVARPDRQRLAVTQWLLTRFHGEEALLQEIARSCRGADLLVTYNGKSFDSPLLSSRFRMHGQLDPFQQFVHLDMLHPIRRFWGRRWPDCRLAQSESRLLGVHRIDDLPGSEAPACWFAWIRNGDPTRLGPVLRHNLQDLISLAALPGAVTRAAGDPVQHGVDPLALARHHERLGARRAAIDTLTHGEADLDATGLLYLAALRKRAGQWTPAVAIWQQLAVQRNANAAMELAKFYEHRAKDLAAALDWTRLLMQIEGCARVHASRERRILRKMGTSPHRSPGCSKLP